VDSGDSFEALKRKRSNRAVWCGAHAVYAAVVAGLLFHTSDHPVVLGKYSLVMSVVLLAAITLWWPYIKFVRFIFSESTIKRQDGRAVAIRPIHKIMFNVVLLALCLVPVEVAIRVMRERPPNIAFLREFHPFLQNRLDVHDKKLPVNSLGFRGEEIDRVKPPGTFRVFVLGGSTVLSDRVSFEKSHVRVLEKLLRQHAPDKRIEVLNAGNHWHTSQHSLIKYLFKIKNLEPDLIIVWHAINDLYRSFSYEKQAFGEYQSDYGHFYGPISRLVLDHAKPKTDPPVVNIVSLRIALDRVRDTLYSDFTARGRSPGIRAVPVRDFASLESFIRNMSALARTVQGDNVGLVFATQPSLYREELSTEESERFWVQRIICRLDKTSYPDMESMIFGMDLFNRATKDIATQFDVPLFDLASALPKTTDNFLDDVHLSEKGNTLVGKAMFRFLVSNGLLR